MYNFTDNVQTIINIKIEFILNNNILHIYMYRACNDNNNNDNNNM